MRVLVTGGAGFIGTHLCKRLVDDGHKVSVYDKVDGPDICCPSSLWSRFDSFAADVVIHLAAEPGVRNENAQLQHDTNCTGTFNVLEACRVRGAKRFIFASSSSVCGGTLVVPTQEFTKLAPMSLYAATKAYGEHLCRVYHHLHGIETVVLRFFNVYGPGGRKNTAVPVFVERILKGEPIQLNGDGSIMRDFTYVSDIVDGIVRAMTKDCAGEVLNLGSGRPHRLRGYHSNLLREGLIDIIEEVTGKEAIIEEQPANPADIPRNQADHSKATRMLSWAPTVDLWEGIKLMVKHYEETGSV